MTDTDISTPWGIVDRASSNLTDEQMNKAIIAALTEYHKTRTDSFDDCLQRMVQEAQKAVSNGI